MKITFAKTEIVFATCLLLYFSFAHVHRAVLTQNAGLDVQVDRDVVIPVVFYLTFLFMNFRIARINGTHRIYSVILEAIILYIIVTLSLCLISGNFSVHELTRNSTLTFFFLGLAYLYMLLKDAVRNYNAATTLYNQIIRKTLPLIFVAFCSWLIILLAFSFFFWHFAWNTIFLNVWATLVPYAFLTFVVLRSLLIPVLWEKESDTTELIAKLVAIAGVLYVPCWILLTVNFEDIFKSQLSIGLSWVAIMILTLPLSFYVYKRDADRRRHTVQLTVALEESVASLQFLRAQINPHFLYNALNTLYASALSGQIAETAKGIQKLGDIMRFMMEENHKESILLSKEIEYMRNFIDLQLLRTRSYKLLTVETRIEEVKDDLNIAPMLLIPFVENAFKHGLSLSLPSFINILLTLHENRLSFQVQNSVHTPQAHDPEKDRRGIGLENVKQRLALLYPDRHTLTLTQTAHQFSAHLIISLL